MNTNKVYYANLYYIKEESEYLEDGIMYYYLIVPIPNLEKLVYQLDSKTFINLKTNEKYLIGQKIRNPKKYIGNQVVSFNNIKPFNLVTGNKISKLSLNEILKIDESIKSLEQTLAIIKPDGIKNIDKIINMIYEAGLKIQKYEIRTLDKEILSEHYAHLLDKPFYPRLEQFMLSGSVVVMVLEGINAVEKLRNLMGPTDSTKASSDTIRGLFGTDVTINAIHGSDSKENALIEIDRFFKTKQKKI